MINENYRVHNIFLSKNFKRGILIGHDNLPVYLTGRRAIAVLVLDQLFRIRRDLAIDPVPLTKNQMNILERLMENLTIDQWIGLLEEAEVSTHIIK